MNRSDFRFRDPLRVRWAEIDAQRIVFNAHYLMYIDTAIAGYWRALAMPYAPTMAQLEGDLYVRKATLEYEASAHYDDLLEVGVRCGRIGNSSMLFAAGVFRGEQCLVHGELVYVFADPATQTSKPVPARLREVLLGFEAGEPMFDVRVAGWDALAGDAQPLRRSVFVQERGLPEVLVADAADASALHAVAYNRFGAPLAAARLLVAQSGVSQLGRVATAHGVRGVGLGQAVLQALVNAARQRGDREVRLDALVAARAFYRRAGFEDCGAEFSEGGMPHVPMRLAL